MSKYATIDETVKDIINGVPEGITKTKDMDENDSSDGIGLETSKEYAYIYIEDSKVYVISALTERESAIYNTVINGRKLYIPDVFALKPSNDASRSVRVLPLIKTLNECGFNITHNNSEAIIKVGAKTYIVDFQNEKITCDSKNVELDLAISEPELWYQKSNGNEMYCSSFIVRALIEYMGHNVYLFDVESGIYIILQDQ